MPDATTISAVFLANGLAVSTAVLIIFREIRRILAFDARLAVVRRQAVVAPGLSLRDQHDRFESALRTSALVLMRAASMVIPTSVAEREKLTVLLRQAGFGKQDALAQYLSAKFVGAVVLAVLGGSGAAHSDTIGQHGFLVAMAAVAGLVAGGIAPEYLLRARKARRLRRMNAALPDALDLMVMCLSSGLTFERAVVTVVEQLEPIERSLADEFRLLEAELRLASNRRSVLEAYYRRTEIDGLRDLAMTLIQSDRYGTPLTQSIKNVALSERTQRAARLMARIERLPVLMTLPMLLFVVPGTMLLVAGPAFLSALNAISSVGGK